MARPPELDILPAWYTDPLPLGDNGSSNGHVGNGGCPGRRRAALIVRRVVGEPPVLRRRTRPSPRPSRPTRRARGCAHRSTCARSGIRSELGAPPVPPPPAAKAALRPGHRRHPEAAAAARAAGRAGAAGGCRAAAHLRQAYSAPDQAVDRFTPARREERSEPAAPAAPTAPQPDGPAGAPPPAGPPALPVIVLIVVLAVLVLGIVWLVVTGDDSGTPADEPAPEVVVAPTGLTVTPDPGEISRPGRATPGTPTSTVLSPAEPPQALPAAPGLSALVPSAGSAPGQRCYTVAVAPSEAGGQPGPASEPPAPGVSPASMMPAP